MKTVKLLLLLFAATSLFNATAGTSGNIDRELDKIMTFPVFEEDQLTEGIVHCTFYFDDKCRIIFKQLEGTNASLEAYVLDRLYDLDCPIIPNQEYAFRFVFRKER